MKLYMVPAAPNPTKVMLYIAEREELGARLGIEQVVVNTLKGRHKEPEHLARNPFGTLPVLELADGGCLLESLSIINYLEERFPENGLLGEGAEARARARDLERVVELRLAIPLSRYAHAVNSPIGYPANPEAAQEIEKSLPAALDYVGGLLGDGRDMLGGDRAGLADCTLQAALQFLRFTKVSLPAMHPQISAWDDRYRTRPAAQKVLKF